MKSASKRPSHITRGSVFEDLGFSPEQAAALKFKAELYQAILKCARRYSQKELQIIFAEPQPRVSELLNGKIANKSVDKLLYYAGRLGIEAKAKFVQMRRTVMGQRITNVDISA
jgi:predicted XRE-type DNA-binding protein